MLFKALTREKNTKKNVDDINKMNNQKNSKNLIIININQIKKKINSICDRRRIKSALMCI